MNFLIGTIATVVMLVLGYIIYRIIDKGTRFAYSLIYGAMAVSYTMGVIAGML